MQERKQNIGASSNEPTIMDEMAPKPEHISNALSSVSNNRRKISGKNRPFNLLDLADSKGTDSIKLDKFF